MDLFTLASSGFASQNTPKRCRLGLYAQTPLGSLQRLQTLQLVSRDRFAAGGDGGGREGMAGEESEELGERRVMKGEGQEKGK